MREARHRFGPWRLTGPHCRTDGRETHPDHPAQHSQAPQLGTEDSFALQSRDVRIGGGDGRQPHVYARRPHALRGSLRPSAPRALQLREPWHCGSRGRRGDNSALHRSCSSITASCDERPPNEHCRGEDCSRGQRLSSAALARGRCTACRERQG